MVSLCGTYAYITGVNGTRKLSEQMKSGVSVLDIDYRLRERIRTIDIPYWKNPENELPGIIELLVEPTDIRDDVVFLDNALLYTDEGYAEGLYIKWKFKEKVYETKEFFR